MISKINRRRILIFLAFAFGISWVTGLVIFLTGGLENGPSITLGDAEVSLAFILLSTTYMMGPAFANLFTRIITKEGKTNLFLQPNFSDGRWIFYAAAWVLPGLLVIAGAAVFFICFPQYYDASLSTLSEMLASTPGMGSVNPWLIALAQTLQAILIAPVLNALSTFGEEFGWRGYLQPKLMPLGSRKSVLLTGIIWGVWHWPVILMGYNYGKDYFGAPFLGPLAMVWFTLTLSIIFGWVTIKADNVWPAVIAHGALNGIAAISLIFVQGDPNSLLGPTPVGLIGGIGLTIAAGIIFLMPNVLKPKKRP